MPILMDMYTAVMLVFTFVGLRDLVTQTTQEAQQEVDKNIQVTKSVFSTAQIKKFFIFLTLFEIVFYFLAAFIVGHWWMYVYAAITSASATYALTKLDKDTREGYKVKRNIRSILYLTDFAYVAYFILYIFTAKLF